MNAPADPLPPYNIEAENGIIGTALLDPAQIAVMRELIVAPDFFRDSLGEAWTLLCRMTDEGEPIDGVTFGDRLQRQPGWTGKRVNTLLEECTDSVPHALNGPVYAGIVARTARAREAIDVCNSALRDLYSGNGVVASAPGRAAEALASIQERTQDSAANARPAVGYATLADADLGLVSAASIEPEAVEYLWPDRIARGRLTLVLGDGGDGKSQWAAAEIAAVSTRGTHVDGSGPAPQGHCFILAAEDGAGDTIIPRLLAAGADLNHVSLLTARLTIRDKAGKPQIHPQSFQDLTYWRTVLTRRPNPALLVGDPLPAYLGRGVNDHRNNEVRAVLEPFIALLDELGIALVGITHVGKTIDARTPAHRALGSVAYSNLARSVLATARDPDDHDRRLLMHVKNNLGPLQPTLAYRIQEHHIDHRGRPLRTSRLQFEPTPVDVDPAEVMCGGSAKRPGPAPKKTSAVALWLFDWLKANDNAQPLAAIFDAAGAAGLIGEPKSNGKWSGVATLYAAKQAIGSLPDDRSGCDIDTLNAPFRPGSRDVTWWRLTGENAKPAPAAGEAHPWETAF